MRAIKKTGYVIVSLALLLSIWQLVISLKLYDRSLFPSPSDVMNGTLELVSTGVIFEHLKISLLRFIGGYSLASIAGIVLGMIFGRMQVLWNLVDPIIQTLRPVSPIAWSPFIVLWFGIGNAPAIAIIFLAAFFPVLLSTVTAVRKVNPTYLKLAQNLELSSFTLFTKVIFPAAFPTIANGLHIAVGTAWIFLVSGEMVGTQSGLGFLIVDSRHTLRLDLVLVGIIFIGVCGLLLDQCVRLFERWMEKKWGIQSK